MKQTYSDIITVSKKIHIHVGKKEEKTYIYGIHSDDALSLEITIDMKGIDSTLCVYCIVFGKKQSHITLRTIQNHLSVSTKSTVLVRAVLAELSEFEFDGLIHIPKHLDAIDAKKQCDVLTLSSKSRAIIKPNLEIVSNGVVCRHAASVGSIPNEECMYLESRGISKAQAKLLFIHGFLSHGLEDINDILIKKYIQRTVSLLE